MTLGKKMKAQLELIGQNLAKNVYASLTQTLEHSDRYDIWKPTVNSVLFFYNPFLFPKQSVEKII